MNDRKYFRLSRYGFYDYPYGSKELLAQASLLSLIPSIRVFNISSGRRTKDEWLHLGRLRICSKTSSQGIPLGPERSRSSNRRSNS